MAISSKQTRVVHVSNSGVSQYPFPFKVFEAGHLAVIVLEADGSSPARLALGLDYSVGGLDVDSGGTVTLSPAGQAKAGTGKHLVIMRDMPFLQEESFSPQTGILWAATVEHALDLAAQERQQLLDESGRAVKLPPDQSQGFNYLDFLANVAKAEEAAEDAEASADRAESAAGVAAETAAAAIRGQLAEYVRQGQSAANSSINAADNSCECATAAIEAARRAEEAAAAIPGFSNNVHNFVGLRVEGFTLFQDKSEDGDEMRAADYGYMTLLPVLSNFRLREGALILEQPFAR